jgi:hypothetical protein
MDFLPVGLAFIGIGVLLIAFLAALDALGLIGSGR